MAEQTGNLAAHNYDIRDYCGKILLQITSIGVKFVPFYGNSNAPSLYYFRGVSYWTFPGE